MARVTSKRIETPELQGEGSYIIVRPLEWKITKLAREFLAIGDVSVRTDMTDEQKIAHIKEETRLTEMCLFGSILEWNWSDEEGRPLPLPRTPEDLDALTNDEVSFLTNCALGKYEAKAKN